MSNWWTWDADTHVSQRRARHGAPGWKLTEEQAIQGIHNGKWTFYVERPTGHRVYVVIATSQYGHEYLKTEADGQQPNNLLALPECP